jgi:hypothetical protein
VRDHSNHFIIDNGDEKEMKKDDEKDDVEKDERRASATPVVPSHINHSLELHLLGERRHITESEVTAQSKPSSIVS